MDSGSLGYWRKFFRSANSDIFGVVENAILVAASDYGEEFRARRDRIAEVLFSCRPAKCVGCDRVGLHVAVRGEDGGREFKGKGGGCEEKECCGVIGGTTEHGGDAAPITSNCSFDGTEALTEEIDDANRIVGEVYRIKEVLARREDESDSSLLESLKRLQLMALSVDTLQSTEIGKAVNDLRKHSSKQIRNLVRIIIEGWKAMVDEWFNTATALAEATPESMNPSIVNHDGLYYPSLEKEASMATQTPLEFSQLSDDKDEKDTCAAGQIKNVQENKKLTITIKCGNSITRYEDKNATKAQDGLNQTKHQGTWTKSKHQEASDKPTRQQESLYKQDKSLGSDCSLERHAKASNDRKGIDDQKFQSVRGGFQKKATVLQNELKLSDETSDRAKLETAKRKLQEGYRQAENAKKQRMVQIMDVHDLPKHETDHRPPQMRTGAAYRHSANGQRFT